ncbi:MAG: TadE family protein [Acidobacteriota bacterium]
MMDFKMKTTSKKARSESGSSIIELAFLAPWIFFLFVGIFDFGFYSYAAICTQNAARAVALASAQTSTAGVTPCNAALGELRMLPNVGYSPSSSRCSVVMGAPSLTQSTPVNVCVATLTATTTSPCGGTGPLSGISCGDCTGWGGGTPSPTAQSILAVVSYQTIPFVPIPGLLTGQMTLSRGAEVRRTTP